MKKKTYAGLDISENFITCSICSSDEKGIALLGSASVAAKGIANGTISDISEVALAVASAVEKAEAASKTKVLSLLASCDGPALKVYNTKGSITVADKENEIGRREVERVTEAAKTIALPYDREIVHTITREFIVDGQDAIKDPTGMFGSRLEVDMEFVTALVSNLHNLRMTINSAGFEIQNVVLSGVAAANAILEELDKDLGVIFIYITYSSTHIVVYNGLEIRSIEVIPLGSGDVIEPLTGAFKLPADYAEGLLKREVNLDKPLSPEDDKISMRLGGSSRSLSRQAVVDAVKPVAEKLIARITETVRKMNSAKEAATGCVVAGELAGLGGFLEMLEISLAMPVKMGLLRDVSGGDLSTVQPGQIVSIGLAKYWSKEGAGKKVRRNIFGNSPIGKVFERINQIFSEYF